MGPAPGSSKGHSPTDPPMFSPTEDMEVWRREISRWVTTISEAAKKGTDRVYQTVFATLARQLYDRGLPTAQKSIVDEAHSQGLVDFDQEDQIEAVREIVNIIAVDPPIAVVTRLIASFHAVTNCRRRKGEDLQTFVSRFRGLAAEHLMHAGVSASSQVGEVLAITLLNNASLSEDTLTSAKLQLIGFAESRKRNEPDPSLRLSPADHSKVDHILGQLKELREDRSLKVYKKDTLQKAARKAVHVRSKLNELVSDLGSVAKSIKELNKPSDKAANQMLFSSGTRCRLHLDDAVAVMRNISSSPKPSVSMTPAEIENLIGQRVNKALLAINSSSRENSQTKNRESSLQSRKTSTQQRPSLPSRLQGRIGKRRNTRSTRPPRVGPSGSASFCYDCGSSEHKRGHDSCSQPSFVTKQIRAQGGYDNPAEKKDRSSSEQDQHFRMGSNPSKRRHA